MYSKARTDLPDSANSKLAQQTNRGRCAKKRRLFSWTGPITRLSSGPIERGHGSMKPHVHGEVRSLHERRIALSDRALGCPRVMSSTPLHPFGEVGTTAKPISWRAAIAPCLPSPCKINAARSRFPRLAVARSATRSEMRLASRLTKREGPWHRRRSSQRCYSLHSTPTYSVNYGKPCVSGSIAAPLAELLHE
jgi:hypothetical protein